MLKQQSQFKRKVRAIGVDYLVAWTMSRHTIIFIRWKLVKLFSVSGTREFNIVGTFYFGAARTD